MFPFHVLICKHLIMLADEALLLCSGILKISIIGDFSVLHQRTMGMCMAVKMAFILEIQAQNRQEESNS